MADDVQLPDLEVMARYSLALRAATAPREEVVAALQADLTWLTGRGAGSRRAGRPVSSADAPAPARRRRAPRPAAE